MHHDNDNQKSSHANPVLANLDRGKLLKTGAADNHAAAAALRSLQQLIEIDELGDSQIAWNDFPARLLPEGMQLDPYLEKRGGIVVRERVRPIYRAGREREVAAADDRTKQLFTGAAFPRLYAPLSPRPAA